MSSASKIFLHAFVYTKLDHGLRWKSNETNYQFCSHGVYVLFIWITHSFCIAHLRLATNASQKKNSS